MIKVLRVGHATFTTPDLEREVAYYSDVLGLIVTERDKNRAFLATRTGVEVTLCDEWLTTRQAQQRLQEGGRKVKDSRQRIDSAAAAVLLQSWLDGRGAGSG